MLSDDVNNVKKDDMNDRILLLFLSLVTVAYRGVYEGELGEPVP